MYQAILIPPNDLQKQHDQIYNLISSLLSINAGNIKQQLSCDLINLDKNINLLLSEPITLCAAASASYTLDENEHSIIQLYDDARAERNSQILHKLDTTITRYKEFQELYSYISEGERKLQKHANDLQVLIIDNVAGNLSTITDDSILQFIDNLTDEIASKLVIDLKTLLGASTDPASLAAAKEAVVVNIKQTLDTLAPENIPAKPPIMLSFNAYRDDSAVSNRTASSNITTSTSTSPRNKHSCSKGYN